MSQCYEVLLGGSPVGKVEVNRQGLYLHIRCRCQIEGTSVLRLFAQLGDRRENLGVVVPEGDGFCLEKRIPAKRLEGGALRFFLSGGGTALQGQFVPICPEEPFRYIDRLKTAFLQSEHGKIGIRLDG